MRNLVLEATDQFVLRKNHEYLRFYGRARLTTECSYFAAPVLN